MNKKVGVFFGGISAEREVSIKSGKAVIAAAEKLGFDCYPVDVTREFLSKLDIPSIDVAFIAMHGRYGEDGKIQSLFELKSIPYTGSDVISSAISLNKKYTKIIFKQADVPSAGYEILRYPNVTPVLGLPFIVKPVNEGSSIGMSIIRDRNHIKTGLEQAYTYDKELLVEKYISGREFTISFLNNEPLPVIEILPKKEFYDYAAKYTAGLTDFIVPARINNELRDKLQKTAIKAFHSLDCNDFGRVDIMERQGKLFVLEVNTIPGLTEFSLLPKAAKAAGFSFEKMIEAIILNAYKKEK